jgi:hypothetical protein
VNKIVRILILLFAFLALFLFVWKNASQGRINTAVGTIIPTVEADLESHSVSALRQKIILVEFFAGL